MKITPLSQVTGHNRCPKCGNRTVLRNSVATGVKDISGFTLWDLTEACNMCGWATRTANVKVGA